MFTGLFVSLVEKFCHYPLAPSTNNMSMGRFSDILKCSYTQLQASLPDQHPYYAILLIFASIFLELTFESSLFIVHIMEQEDLFEK